MYERCEMRWSMICYQPATNFFNTLHKEGSSGCVLAAGDVLGVFVGNSTAGADILDCWLPSGEVSITAVEVRDVSCYPILEGLGEFIHDFWDDFPVNQVKAVPWYLIALVEEVPCKLCAPVFVDGFPGGGSNLLSFDGEDDVLIWE